MEALVKDIAERMKTLRNTLPAVGKQERAKMERQRLQDNLLELLTQLKDVDKMLSVEMKKRNESERRRLESTGQRTPNLVDVNKDPSQNPFFGGDANGANQTSEIIDPLHQVLE